MKGGKREGGESEGENFMPWMIRRKKSKSEIKKYSNGMKM